MSEFQKVVLIGDPNEARFKWLRELLADVYAIGAVQAKNFEEVKKFARDHLDTLSVAAVFLTDDLPFTINLPKTDPYVNFIKLEEHFYDAAFVCIVTRDPAPNLDGVNKQPHLLHLRTFPPNTEGRQRLIVELGSLGRLRPAIEISAIDKITEWNKGNRTLRRQIRSLGEAHDLADGSKHLLRLIRNCLDCELATKIEIKQLGQGKSGASVFHLTVKYDDHSQAYVLKLSGSDALWKLESEVLGHLEARESTGLPHYKEHVAALRRPIYSIDPADRARQFIVDSGQWYAIHYDFLGGPTFGKFIDLETELTASPETLMEKTEGTVPALTLSGTDQDSVLEHRLKIFGTTLDGLCELWYGNEKLATRRVETLWKVEDAPEREFIRLPPYQLTQRTKGWIQDFLDSREAMIGERLFPSWLANKDQVLNLVSDDATIEMFGRLNERIPFTLSPVHGDLNANNVLLWLQHEKYPFVIDLPFYQQQGHAMQDFARLEAEIKLALLDRQEESPLDQLPAYDHAYSQFSLWIEMEDRLARDSALSELELTRGALITDDWNAKGFKDNVTLCYRLVMLLRQTACRVQQKTLDGVPAAPPFAIEYLPALLYHSLRAIGYPSLSVFKRLLAVYGCGLILKRLE